MRAEAEVKIQLTEEEFQTLPDKWVNNDILQYCRNIEELTDWYVECEKSKYGGWDFTRVRKVGLDEYLLTHKEWTSIGNNEAIRLEEESTLSSAQIFFYNMNLEKVKLRLEKTRCNFPSKIGDLDVLVSFDNVTSTKEPLYFVECEAIVEDYECADTNNKINEWFRSIFIPALGWNKSKTMLELALDNQREA